MSGTLNKVMLIGHLGDEKLNSNDKDAINNLKMVNNAIIDDITKIPEPFIESQLNKISNVLSFRIFVNILTRAQVLLSRKSVVCFTPPNC